jgi:tRNA A-37 threonylcarbamoyl transferase component Bud32
VKFSGASRAIKDLLRPASSIRSADLHARLGSVRTPAPLVALELRRGPFLEGSLLVAEFVPGPTLREAFQDDERARKALAPFLALLHRNGVFHGDLHPANMI